ncbi:MAG: O-antigen ligase family protein [Candidatus Binatia bacterium]
MNEAARNLVKLIFFYTCIEGLIINIWYPSKLPFLYKDFAILAVYVLVFLPNLNRLFAPSPTLKKLTLPLLFFSVIAGLYLLLPGTGLLAGLFALKQKLFYIPLISIGYFFVRSDDDLKRLFSALALYAIGASAFGIYLYFRGPEGLRELGATYSAVLWTPRYEPSVQQYWRVPGTFTSAGQYSSYLLFSGLIAAALLMAGYLSKRWKGVTTISMALIVLAMLASGTRASVVLLSASMAILVLLSQEVKGLIRWGLVGYAVLAFGFTFLGPGVEERFASIATYEHVKRFQTTYFGQLFLPALLENPFGMGLGISTVGTRHLSESAEIQLVESYLGILAMETGVLGLGTFLWVAIAIGALILRLRREIQGMPEAVLWYALAVYVSLTIVVLPISTAIDHGPTNFYFWFSIGVLFKLADLERQRRMVVPAHSGEQAETVWQPTFSPSPLAWKPQIR